MMLPGAIGSVLAAFAYSLACLGLGAGAWAALGCKQGPKTAECGSALLASQLLLGVLLYSATLTALGLVGGLRLIPIVVLLWVGLAGLWFARRQLGEALAGARGAFTSWRREPASVWLIALATAVLGLGFAIAAWMRPPEGDAEAFYLVYPKIMAATGRLQGMPGLYDLFSSIGLPAELHYTALMVLADARAAKLFVWPVALATGALLAAITTECGGGRLARVLSWTIVLSSSTFNHYIYDGKVDIFAAGFGLAAAYWVIACPPAARQNAGVALAGLFAGSAAVAKFSYIPSLGVTLAMLTVWRHGVMLPAGSPDASDSRIPGFAIKVAVMAVMAALAWVPQLLKNGILFGAPLAPFLAHTAQDDWLNQVWFPPDVTRHILLTYPLALVFGRYPMQGGGLSPLLLAFVPLALLLPRPASWRASLLTGVTASGIGALLVWMMLRPSVIAPRYILASLLMLVPIVAIATEAAVRQAPAGGLLRLGGLATSLTALAAGSWHLMPLPGAILATLRGQSDGCLMASYYCKPMTGLALNGHPGERIFIAAYYAYWLRPDQLQCRDSSEESRLAAQKEDLMPWLRQHGFRYVIVDRVSHPRIDAEMQRALKESDRVKAVAGEATLAIYQLAPDSAPLLRCVQKARGRWQLERVLR